MSQTRLFLGDCLDALRQLPDASVDAVVTDPPYGLSFMGKKWDYDVPSVEVWAECLRVLKPGGHLLAFAGTRTQHRMAVRIEDAGFEIRDMIAWVYGSGFPKSLDVSKAIDRAAGAEREFMPVGSSVKRLIPGAEQDKTGSWIKDDGRIYQPGVSAPATDAARQWQGWGTALKPALEPITVARKPLSGTVATTVLEHGTGALNVDGCRVGTDGGCAGAGAGAGAGARVFGNGLNGSFAPTVPGLGRWPANLIHDGSEEVTGLLGEAARFFYTPKADGTDRNEGTDARNIHPTVKPTDLMQYLCRLVTPPGGTVLDPFMGSGSTGKAAQMEGFRFIGCERDPDYFAIAKARVETAHGSLFASIADIEVNAA
ncbi:MAG: site-specific DNA-methyltransferase [Phenylobacterium sp.]|nr:site-specific DNA-methyltransferase [Phenylobacterium sp.]